MMVRIPKVNEVNLIEIVGSPVSIKNGTMNKEKMGGLNSV